VTSSIAILRSLLKEQFRRQRLRAVAFDLFDLDWFSRQANQKFPSKRSAFRAYLSRKDFIYLDPFYLFDANWYGRAYPDVRKAGFHPFLHFLFFGWIEGRDPHPFFSLDWYQKTMPRDAVASKICPLVFFTMHADQNLESPHPLFDPVYYKGALTAVGISPDQKLFEYFVKTVSAGRAISPHPLITLDHSPELERYGVFHNSWAEFFRGPQSARPTPLFDASWYLDRYGDVREASIDPLYHFVMNGALENRNPNELFDTKWYRDNYMLLATKQENPLSHFLLKGAFYGAKPCPTFDSGNIKKHFQLNVDGAKVLEFVLLNKQLLPAMHPRNELSIPMMQVDSSAPLLPLLIEITYDKTLSPQDVGESDDSRQLAIALESIRLTDLATNEIIAVVIFNARGNAKSYVLYGVSFLESWGAWSQGQSSALIFWVNKIPRGPLRLDVNAHPYSHLKTLNITINSSNGLFHSGPFERPSIINLHPVLNRKNDSGNFLALLHPVSFAPPVAETPKLSVIILNYNKSQLSILSAMSVINSSPSIQFEILIVDNGSEPDEVEILRSSKLGFTLVELSCNRYFGEGNNLGFERTRGEYVLFLNNDAFLTPGLADLLVNHLEDHPEVGAVGPCFLYPDGQLQEVGAFVKPDGTAFQRGKGASNFNLQELEVVSDCDYVSAACVLLRASDFKAIGGFNYRFDPAYYEDTDLCFRLFLLGKKTQVLRLGLCYHIENATTGKQQTHSGPSLFVERNKEAFMSIWGPFVQSRRCEDLPNGLIPKYPSISVSDFSAAVYTPYPLTMGGGEAYILSTAAALSTVQKTAVFTPDAYSNLRLNNLVNDLGIEQGNVSTFQVDTSKSLAVSVVMGNYFLPRVALRAERQFYHCQFPFPEERQFDINEINHRRILLKGMNGVIVNSNFTAKAYLGLAKRCNLDIAVHVCSPPVDTTSFIELPGGLRQKNIVSIGRFTPNGHSKRQDVILRAFARTSASFRKSWKLLLCGTIPTDRVSENYVRELKKLARGLPVEFVFGPSREKLREILATSAVYVHATGFGVSDPCEYHLCEHFGITVVEATSAGCHCISYALGGPAEIFDAVGVGRTYWTIEELSEAMEEAPASSTSIDFRRRASRLFGQDSFRKRMLEIVTDF